MARKKGWRTPDEIREKIQGSLLINRLQDHATSEMPDGIMSTSQVNAAKILLNKVIPDLKAIEHSGDADNPMSMVAKVDWCIVEPSK